MPHDATAAPAATLPAGMPLATPEGLRSASITVTAVEAPHVAALRRELWSRWEPADPVEVDQVEALLVVRLKEARLDKLELEVLAARGAERAALPSLATLGRYRRQLERQQAAIEAAFVAFRDALDEIDAGPDEAVAAGAASAGTARAASIPPSTATRVPIDREPLPIHPGSHRDTDEPERPRYATVDGAGSPSARAA